MKFLRKILIWTLCLYVGGITVLYFEQEKIMFHPKKLRQNYQFQFEEEFEEIFLTTADHKEINALYFRAENPKGVLLIFHGNTGNLQSCGNEAAKYLPMGYDVFMPDFRSFGKSDRTISEENLLSDALLAFDFLSKMGWKKSQITIYGRSLGTAMAAYTASKRKHKQLILYTPYCSMKRLAVEKYPFVPSFVVAYPLETERYLKNFSGPVYLFHGTKDRTIPLAHSKALKSMLGPKAKLTIIQGGEHDNLDRFPLFRAGMKQILNP